MILKVRGTDGGWWFFEGDTIHHYTRTVTLNKDSDDVFGGRYDETIIKSGCENWEERTLIVADVTKCDQGEQSIIFDTVAYLCNDKGETIEKLTV